MRKPHVSTLRRFGQVNSSATYADSGVPHVLRHASFLLLRVAEAVAFQRAIGARAGCGLIELHQPQIAHEHELDQVH